MDLKGIISKIKSLPIDLRELGPRLPPRFKTIQYKDLTRSRGEMFKNTDGFVVHIPHSNNKVGHFVVLLAKRNHIEFFSSLGGTPQSTFKRLGQDISNFSKLVGQHYIYNSKALQSNAASIEDCACWCLARAYLHKLKLRDFQKLFSKKLDLQNPDEIVSIMCLLLLST